MRYCETSVLFSGRADKSNYNNVLPLTELPDAWYTAYSFLDSLETRTLLKDGARGKYIQFVAVITRDRITLCSAQTTFGMLLVFEDYIERKWKGNEKDRAPFIISRTPARRKGRARNAYGTEKRDSHLFLLFFFRIENAYNTRRLGEPYYYTYTQFSWRDVRGIRAVPAKGSRRSLHCHIFVRDLHCYYFSRYYIIIIFLLSLYNKFTSTFGKHKENNLFFRKTRSRFSFV